MRAHCLGRLLVERHESKLLGNITVICTKVNPDITVMRTSRARVAFPSEPIDGLANTRGWLLLW